MADADGKNKKGCCQKLGDGFSNFGNFVYNKETGQVMGRSGKSWAKIGFFYLIFYGCLAGFFSGMLAVFLTTLNDPEKGGPKLTQYVANQPGLTRLDQANILKSSYNQTNTSAEVKAYTDLVETFLEKYEKIGKEICTTINEDGMPEADCRFNKTLLDKCEKSPFGLTDGEPCIFVKVNKVYGWVPKSNDGLGFLKLKCDNENVNIYPDGFQISAFPFRGQKNFELPVVAVKFNVSNIKEVHCWLEGKDIVLSESYQSYRSYGRIRIRDSTK